MDPKMAPKVVQKLVKIRSIFGPLFFEVLELFKCLLGAFLGLPRLAWTALDRQNNEKQLVFKVFANEDFP